MERESFVSQSFNSDAFRGTFDVLFRNPQRAIPHFSISTIVEISPQKIYDQGVRAVIFDKDNTITAPYVNTISPSLETVMNEFRSVFGENIAILSNSAGTKDDIDYRDANEIEEKLELRVIRHEQKKPEGSNDVGKWFNCDVNQIVMIGDRLLTDTLFGNKAGLLTIHTGVLTLKGDNIAAVIARSFENLLLKRWIRQGVTALTHPLGKITLR